LDLRPRSDVQYPYVALGWALFIIGLSSIPGEDLPSPPILNFDKLAHVGVYGVLGALVYLALLHQAKFPFLIRNAFLASTFLGSAYGVTDELHQLFVPGRSCDILDWTADTIGVIVGILVIRRALHWYERRKSAPVSDSRPGGSP